MSDPKPEIMGNNASEQGAFNEGADFVSINQSGLPDAGEPIEVSLERHGKDLVVRPVSEERQQFRRGTGLQHSAKDLTEAQICEEPEVFLDQTREVLSGFLNALRKLVETPDKVGDRGALAFYEVRPGQISAAVGDRIIVLQDTLESEHSCRECHGKGHTEEVCKQCHGKQIFSRRDEPEQPCAACKILGFDFERPWSCGRTPCRACLGSGWKGGIIIPEIAQTRPVTGIVVSVGPLCRLLKIGDRILHSKYAGHSVNTPEGKTFTTMHEHEMLWLMKEI